MSHVGTSYTVRVHEAEPDYTVTFDSVEFHGSFVYEDGFTSTVKVTMGGADIEDETTAFDSFQVTYLYTVADTPDLSSKTIQDLVDDAVTAAVTAGHSPGPPAT